MMTLLKVTGMSCQHCVQAVIQAIEAVPGVSGVEVDLASGFARVEGEAESSTLIAAVTAAGYRAEPA